MVDARMGRGKSSAAIRYMNENKCNKRFLYVTPFLGEVDRICVSCDFDQPNDSQTTKSSNLKTLLYRKENIASTHSLFLKMDDEALDIAKKNNYTIIIDESIQIVEALRISKADVDLILKLLCVEDEYGRLHWKDHEYVGRFADYKEMADSGSLYRVDGTLVKIVNPKIFDAFNEVIIMTYMFRGQYLRAYLDYYKFPYRIVGVEKDDRGYLFSDKPDRPDPIDFSELIKIIDNEKMNSVGNNRNALSLAWFNRRSENSPEIRALRRSMNNFFRHYSSGKSEQRLFTCYKDHWEKLIQKDGRYRNNYLQISAKATNEWRHATDVAYMANRFSNPNILKFFSVNESYLNQSDFALAEMLQFIWRSAIRDGKPITLYIPSKRMRTLLIQWMDDVKNGKA